MTLPTDLVAAEWPTAAPLMQSYCVVQEIRDKYPPWLEQHKSDRSEAEMKCYEAQYASICRLCDAYETDPDNYSKLMTLLQEVRRPLLCL